MGFSDIVKSTNCTIKINVGKHLPNTKNYYWFIK